MFTVITCPACQHKLTVPEGTMGKRQTCPNCHTPFMAGKSTSEAEAEISMKLQPAAPAGFNKTMLGDTAPAIKFNCPRCKKPLEAPAIEAGTKKPCPECGQRLQVPPAPTLAPAAGAAPNLNKTLLASDDTKPQAPQPPIKYNCPNCKKPLEAPASEALTKKNCPACGQRMQVPAAPPPGAGGPNLNKTVLASDDGSPRPAGYQAGLPLAAGAAMTIPSTQAGAAAGPAPDKVLTPRVYLIGAAMASVMAFILLLVCMIGLFTSSGAKAAKGEHEQAMKDLEKLKAEMEAKRLEMANARKAQDDIDQERKRQKADEDRQQRQFEARLQAIQDDAITDKKTKAELENTLRAQKQAAELKAMEREQEAKIRKQENEDKAAAAKVQADAAAAAAQRQTTIIQAPPPYYYRYNPYYYYGW